MPSIFSVFFFFYQLLKKLKHTSRGKTTSFRLKKINKRKKRDYEQYNARKQAIVREHTAGFDLKK